MVDGQKSIDDIRNCFERFDNVQSEEESGELDYFVTDDLEELYIQTIASPGIRWRLDALNKSLGSLRKGDFGFIFARPESYSRDTEILTPSGWITVDKVTTNTKIAQVTSDLKVEFVYPKAVHEHEQDYCYHIYDTLGRVDLIVTEGHAMVCDSGNGLYKERADTVKYYQGIKHHVAAQSSAISYDLNPIERCAIAYQADGHTRNYKGYGYTFSFKKQRKIDRLSSILTECNWEFSTYKDGNRGHTGFYVKTTQPLFKNFDWIDLNTKSKEWCKQFIEELSYWDATKRTNTRYKFDTTDRSVADKVQAIAILAGYNCLLSSYKDNRKDTYSTIYTLTIRTDYKPVDGQSIHKERIVFTDTTYCFEVPSGMLLVRRNGATAVCGNTGKTTFLASEVSYFATQVNSPVLWLNNEEGGSKVKIRIYQACLGKTLTQLMSNRQENKKLYEELTNNSVKLWDSATLSKRDIEQVCALLKPSLVVIDQIDKLKGFQADREDLLLGSIYIWARELAKEYCPIIGVSQAGATAEGKKYLTMDDVANAKTAKQAEADWILGIGKSHNVDEEYTRFFSICKNKLAGDSDTLPELRHGKFPVIIEPEIGRYKDII